MQHFGRHGREEAFGGEFLSPSSSLSVEIILMYAKNPNVVAASVP
jgi:hypothetical protein